MVEYGSESSDDDEANMCVAEWSWASKSKSFVCSSLKPTSKSQQDSIRFTFDVIKCDRIFDYLLQEKQIKLPSNHVIPSSEQLKKHAYCKWHNSYSHATHDYNDFRRHVQSATNEGRLKFAESHQMKLNKDPFLANMNMVELDGKKVLVWPSQAEWTKGKEVAIGEKTRMIRPKNPEIGRWKKNERSKTRSHPKAPSTSSCLNTEMARPASGVMKTGLSSFPNRTIRYPWISPVLLRQEARPATNPRHCREKIQKVRIIVNRSIIWRLTSRSGHQCLGRGGLRR
jgi:hypothetical protein